MQQKSDNVVSHYVFEAPVRIWHWLTVLCMAVLMVTGYFIGKPLPSVSGEATYLFYMGYIRLIHFSAGMVFTVVLLMRMTMSSTLKIPATLFVFSRAIARTSASS